MNVIFVVAAELDRDNEGKVILGLNTKIACRRAVSIALDHKRKSCPAVIVITACRASAKWDNVLMCSMMSSYVKGLSSEVKAPITYSAAEFTTWGEMQALANLMLHDPQFATTTSVILSVKWWHALRAWVLCRYWLKRAALEHIPIGVSLCPSKPGIITLAGEAFGAWPKNLFRMYRRR